MNSKIYRIGFFILMAVNITLVVFLVVGPKRPPQAAGIKDAISKELEFTKEQRARYDEMAMTHREKVSDLEKQERTLVKLFFDPLEVENSSTEKEKLLLEILALNREKIMTTYTHFEELKAICTDEQLVKFDKVISRIIPALTNSHEPPPINRDRMN